MSIRRGMLGVLLLLSLAGVSRGESTPGLKWYAIKDGQVELFLHVFWSKNCSHCVKVHGYLDDLQRRQPWLKVMKYEVSESPANMELYRQSAQAINRVAGQVPAFFYVKQLEIGFDAAETTGRRLEQNLLRYRDALQKQVDAQKPKQSLAPASWLPILLVLLVADDPPAGLPPEITEPEVELDLDLDAALPAPEEPVVDLPGWGEVKAADYSLPALTVMLGGLDAFNPCAFFVLMILMSLMLRSGSRKRMLLVGSVFVAISGIVYFLFMAAWLNLFVLVGHLKIITLAAGAVALTVAIINIKDFFWFKQGVSLSIPDSAKPGLFQRMNALIAKGGLLGLLTGTATLAFVTNLYELLCTSGLPMVYTRILTLRHMSPWGYYGYLALYNLVYVTPLLIIVTGFALTFSAHKLSEYQGRVLKLLSGMMMLALGVLLVVRPETLSTFTGAVATLLGAILATALTVILHRLFAEPPAPPSAPRRGAFPAIPPIKTSPAAVNEPRH